MASNSKWLAAALVVMACVVLLAGGPLWAKKPPKPPPEPPSLPDFRYELTWLEPVEGGSTLPSATGMNDCGQVVGTSLRPETDESGNPVLDESGNPVLVGHAYVWSKEEGMQDLNDLAPGSPLYLRDAYGINNAGQIVGTGFVEGGTELKGYRFTPGDADYPASVEVIIATLDGIQLQCEPQGINNHGDVTGYTLGLGGHTFVSIDRDGLLGPAELIDIDYPNLYSSRGNAINDAGQVTGEIGIRFDKGPLAVKLYAFRYTPGTPADWEILVPDEVKRGTYVSEGTDLNDHQVVGNSGASWNNDPAFRYTDGVGMEQLGTLDSGPSLATGINVSGEVVGTSTVWTKDLGSFWRGFIYVDGFGMVNLDDLVLNRDALWDLEDIRAHKINASGDVCGTAAGVLEIPFVLKRVEVP